MKIIYIECNENEMKANRTFIDTLTDIAQNIVSALNSPVSDDFGTVDETVGAVDESVDGEAQE